jgi:U3 small nucleolar ribonucleoprotein component
MIFLVKTKRKFYPVSEPVTHSEDWEAHLSLDLSGHEKRVAAIAKQIAELETKNVGEKDWTLIGEATSKKRPHNSLLEEDLDFERVQRPVTAITVEKVASLEALIRKRVIEVHGLNVGR